MHLVYIEYQHGAIDINMHHVGCTPCWDLTLVHRGCSHTQSSLEVDVLLQGTDQDALLPAKCDKREARNSTRDGRQRKREDKTSREKKIEVTHMTCSWTKHQRVSCMYVCMLTAHRCPSGGTSSPCVCSMERASTIGCTTKWCRSLAACPSGKLGSTSSPAAPFSHQGLRPK